jgi:ribosomal protein S18 acetylase RimI-like enzyme
MREAAPGDAEELARMNVHLRADERMDNEMTDAEVLNRMRSMLASPYIGLLFSVAGETAGYTLTDPSRNPPYLRQLYVEERFRRTGLGKRMLEMTADRFGAKTLDLEVMVWNDGAREFYRALGCRERYVGLRYSRNY